MLKEDYIEASKVKKPFEFTYTKLSLDWYEDVNVSIAYDKYNYIALEMRYGSSWWLIGKKYNEDKDKWESEQIGRINEPDIPRLVEWAEYTNRFGHQVSILNEIRAIDGILNPIREFLRIMSRYKVESEENNKESIPYLIHKEMDLPLLECQKAYDIAIEYLRSQAKLKG